MNQRNMMRHAATLVVAAMLVTGCGQALPGSPGTSPASNVSSPDTCWNPYDNSAAPEQTLDTAGNWVIATRCQFDTKRVPGDGEWLVRTDQQATAGLETLTPYLNQPPMPAPSACSAILYAPIIITLTDATGRSIHPWIMRDGCGKPVQAAVDAIDALPWVTIGTTMVRQITSELSVTSGCSDQYKPMIPLTANGSGTQTITPNPGTADVTVCRYDLDPLDGGPDDAGVYHQSGRLASASVLTSAQMSAFWAAVAIAPRAETCTLPDAPFAVIVPGGQGATVELGGCYRVLLDGENSLRQLDATAVAGLLG